MTLGNLKDCVQVRGLSVEVHGDDGARARRYRGLYLRRVDVVGDGVAVDEDRSRAGGRDGLRGREEGVGGDDDFVARADAASGERELNRGRAVRDADAELRADVLRERALERLDLAAQHEGRRVQDALYGSVNLRLYRTVLRL